jgi:hypothetical protein
MVVMRVSCNLTLLKKVTKSELCRERRAKDEKEQNEAWFAQTR